MKIFIDSGHNFSGCDTGATSNGLKEQDITFKVADRLKTLLVLRGYEVKMSRNNITDNIGKTTAESLKNRCIMANEWGADLFISIHCNAGGGKGTETYIYSKNGKSFNYAEQVQKSIVKNLDMIDRGVKVNHNLYVLKNTKAPALLVELGFIDYDKDAEKLLNNINEFASALYTGITGNNFENQTISELTETNDIVWELSARNILSDKNLWLMKLKTDQNAYWLARKCVNYIRSKGV